MTSPAHLLDGGAQPSSLRRFFSVATGVALVGTVAVLVALQVRGLGGDGGRALASPWSVMPTASARVDIGLTTLPLAKNSWDRWTTSDLRSVNAWEQAVRKHASVVMWYADWTTSPPPLRQLNALARRGSIPEITWEPWQSFGRLRQRPGIPVKLQPRYRLRNIIAGRFDPYVRSWARRLAAYRRPLHLRFAQEMNGNWYPWSEHTNGNRPGEFARAWRHVHRIFRAAGATNVRWVWGPAAITMRPRQYPGDAFVDLVGFTMFNGGPQLRFQRWRPFAQLLARPLAQLRRIAPRKPVELSEVGSAEKGGNKAAWISGMFATLPRHPEIVSLIWFDLVKGSDWRVTSSPAATAAFSEGVAASRYR
ncbi:MAG: glycoside hydrolase family 26 protein [Burkholderia ambifaria]